MAAVLSHLHHSALAQPWGIRLAAVQAIAKVRYVCLDCTDLPFSPAFDEMCLPHCQGTASNEQSQDVCAHKQGAVHLPPTWLARRV